MRMMRTATATATIGLALVGAGAFGAPAASAAPPHKPVPAFTFTSHLETLLVAPNRLTRIVGADKPMRGVKTVADLIDGGAGLSPAECAGAFEPARRSAYADSGSTGVSMQLVVDDKPAQAQHVVSQAVIGFRDPDAALKHLDGAARTWLRCGGQTVTYTTASGDTRHWRLGAPELRRDRTVLAQMQTGRSGTCERAMTAANFAGTAVVADVMACDFGAGDPDGHAEVIAASISASARRGQ